MFRRISKQTVFKPVTEEQFEQLIIPLRKMGVTVIRGDDETENRLERFDALGSTLGTDIVMFRRKVSISAVLEETHHIRQNRNGLNDDKEAVLRSLLNEIDAKNYLLRIATQYNIPRLEVEETKRQLSEYRKLLKEYYKRRGSDDA